jgi:hypothetical protein
MLSAMSRSRILPLPLLAAVPAMAQTMLQAPPHIVTPAPLIEPHAPARAPNADPNYAALVADLPTGPGFPVKDLTLERQGATFHFDQGTFSLYAPVNGHITGAIFTGTGQFHIAPGQVSEQRSLALLTRGGVMAQPFTTLILRFTDSTADEIRQAAAGTPTGDSPPATGPATDFAKAMRRTLHLNLELRLLEDVPNPQPGAFFLASFRMGSLFSGRNILFLVDPEGTFHASPDQVELSTWTADDIETWVAYRMQPIPGLHYGLRLHVKAQQLDVAFYSDGKITASAQTTLTVAKPNTHVLPLDLFHSLRVSGVFTDRGEPLDYVQEGKDADPQFAVILPTLAQRGDTIKLLTRYAGPDAVRRDGSNVFYLLPGARDRWYPSSNSFGDYADYYMTFHLPKGLQIVATGKEIEASPEANGGTRAVWATDVPIGVAGFNLGAFKSKVARTPQGFVVSAYANKSMPAMYSNLAFNNGRAAYDATGGLEQETTQGVVAMQIYTSYFGKLPYDHLAITQQSVCNFGQSWPMLVYIPTCTFWDLSAKDSLGLLGSNHSYWDEVTPHEVSHQWWGQLVGFQNYRDQWMSEGFANYSVGVYLLQARTKMDDYRTFWNQQNKLLFQKNEAGVRPIDVGPVTMGYRVANEKTGYSTYQDLIYSKGAYIVHMLEMLFWTPDQQHAPFQKAMHQFVSDYAGKAATTEDFKASIERSMPPWVDLHHDHKLDWFFDEYVYGTEIPHYNLEPDIKDPAGDTTVHFKITQSNVSDRFLMAVPIYLQMQDGETFRLAMVRMQGNTTIDHTIHVGKLPSPVKKLILNYNADVLSD